MDKKRIFVAFLIVLTDTVGATAILPMLPIYAGEQFQATPVQAMLVIAAFYAAQFVAAPWLGKLSDRLGRRSVLIVSQIGTIASYLLFIFAAPLGTSIGVVAGISGGLVLLYIARLLDGVTAGNVSVAEAYASDISDDHSRAHALGLIGGASGLGHILGPALAVALSGINLVAPMIGALVVSGATLILTILVLDETVTSETRSGAARPAKHVSSLQLLTQPAVALILVTALTLSMYVATTFSSFSVYAEQTLFAQQPAEIVIRNVNLIIMLMGLSGAICQIFLVGPLVKRYGEQPLIVTGSLLLLGSAIGISTASLPIVLVAIPAYALGFALSWPSLQAIMTRLSSKETIGRQLGFVQSAFSLAFILAPLLAGYVLEAFGPHAIFHNGALLMGITWVLSLLVYHLSIPVSDKTHHVESQAQPRGLLQRLHH